MLFKLHYFIFPIAIASPYLQKLLNFTLFLDNMKSDKTLHRFLRHGVTCTKWKSWPVLTCTYTVCSTNMHWYIFVIITYILYVFVCIWWYICIITYIALTVSNNTSTSEHQSTSQDMLPATGHLTVHSTPVGEHFLVN